MYAVASNNLLLLVLCLFGFLTLVLFPHQLAGNEEHYFQLGYFRFNPGFLPDTHAIFEQAKGRILFEYLLGFVVEHTGYLNAHILTRVSMALLYAISLALLFRRLQLGLLEALAILSIFLLTGQDLFGDEWIFLSIEPKTYAYFFVFLALYFYLSGAMLATIVCLVAATYFHFLVGVFWAAFVLLGYLLDQKLIAKTLLWGIVYSIGVIPLAILIINSSFAKAPIDYHLSANYIYGAIRLPHHVAPFISSTVFLKNWLPGLGALLLILRLVLELRSHAAIQKLTTLILVAGCFMLAGIVISYLDRETYAAAKFFLFRPSSLTLLLTVICLVITVKPLQQQLGKKTYFILLLLLVAIVSYGELRAVWGKLNDDTPVLVKPELRSVVDTEVGPTEIILIEPPPSTNPHYTRVNRDLQRPTLIEEKFIPSAETDVILWHKRRALREQIFSAGCGLPDSEYSIGFLLVYSDDIQQRFASCSKILYQDKNLYLLKLHSEKQPNSLTN